MHIFVVGRSGQLARALVDRLPPGWTVEAAARERIDLDDPDGAARALGDAIDARRPDAIINAAAYTAVDAAEDEEAAAVRVNGTAPGLLAAVAAQAGVPFLHVSTDYVFSGTSPLPYAEDAEVAPAGAYGRSKAAGERAVVAAGGPAAIVRTAWLFSGDGRNFVTTMLRLARERSEISVVDDQIGNPTSAADLADALLAMVAAWPTRPLRSIYHFAGSGATSWCGFAQEIMAQAAARGLPAAVIRPIATADFSTRAQRPEHSQLATSALTRDFGVVPRAWQAMLGDEMDRIAALSAR